MSEVQMVLSLNPLQEPNFNFILVFFFWLIACLL